jgi:saccharopine dehydrogenase-like NADP-dependent oxidoreductase
MNGDINKHTAMSKTVGGTGVLAGELVLNGQLNNKGMIGPFDMELCSKLYKKLLEDRMIKPYQESLLSDQPKL